MSNRRKNMFRASTTLIEFAESEGLNTYELRAKVVHSNSIKPRYTRSCQPYYYISDLRAWLAENEVTENA